jgi:hypothetical protein
VQLFAHGGELLPTHFFFDLSATDGAIEWGVL